MHDTIEVSWTDRWEALFGYPFRNEAAGKAYIDEVQAAPGVGAVTEAEMVAALRQYAEGERKEGHRAKAPTTGQVATLIKRDRWQRREAAEGGPATMMAVRLVIGETNPARTITRDLGSLRRDLDGCTPTERWAVACAIIGKDADGRSMDGEILGMAQRMPGGVERDRGARVPGWMVGA